MDRLEARQLDAARKIFRGANGELVLAWLRELSVQRPAPLAPALLQRASELGWIAGDPPSLTPLGQVFADSAREYCNWCDDSREFPVDLLPGHLEGLDILDVGCGFGRYVISLGEAGARVVGVDMGLPYLQLGPLLAEHAKAPRPSVARARGEELPIASGRLDVVICLRTLGYMVVREALTSFERVLKPGGRLVLATPTLHHALRRRPRTAGELASWLRLVADSLAVPLVGRRLFSRLDQSLTRRRVFPARGALTRMLRAAGLTEVEAHPTLNADVCWFVARKPERPGPA